jgi:hypothetical protein
VPVLTRIHRYCGTYDSTIVLVPSPALCSAPQQVNPQSLTSSNTAFFARFSSYSAAGGSSDPSDSAFFTAPLLVLLYCDSSSRLVSNHDDARDSCYTLAQCSFAPHILLAWLPRLPTAPKQRVRVTLPLTRSNNYLDLQRFSFPNHGDGSSYYTMAQCS